MQIILASTSRYRKALFTRLALDFDCVPPEVCESPLNGESPVALSLRLAKAKAEAVAQLHPHALVIGSDQVASLNGQIWGKPGTRVAAAAQLRASSGNRVSFYTSIAVMAPFKSIKLSHVEPFHVYFRCLSEDDIEGYLSREPAFDCAGSFKMEGLGVALFAKLEGDDPTSLEGLPLIALCEMLNKSGVNVIKNN